MSCGYSWRLQSCHLEREPRNIHRPWNVQFQEDQTSGHTFGTVFSGAIIILNQNPHLKHAGVSKCHFGIQLPFYSLGFSYLGNRNSLEFAVCGCSYFPSCNSSLDFLVFSELHKTSLCQLALNSCPLCWNSLWHTRGKGLACSASPTCQASWPRVHLCFYWCETLWGI